MNKYYFYLYPPFLKNTVILQLNYKMSMQQSNYIIEVKGVSKFFGDKMVLDNINLYVKKVSL